MHESDIPSSVVIGIASTEGALEKLLRRASSRSSESGKSGSFSSYDIVAGASGECRLFYMGDDPSDAEGSKVFLSPNNPEAVAKLLIRRKSAAAYPAQSKPGARKGWQVRFGYLGNEPVVIVRAVWCGGRRPPSAKQRGW